MNGNAFVCAGTKGSFYILSIFCRYANSKPNSRIANLPTRYIARDVSSMPLNANHVRPKLFGNYFLGEDE